MKTNRAFTVMEMIIIVVIIGLLAAMAIPAFQRVRYSVIEKALQHGESITQAQRQYYWEYRKDHPELIKSPPNNESSAPSSEPSFQRVTIEGKSYYLILKQDVKETEIAGRTFWLIPSQ